MTAIALNLMIATCGWRRGVGVEFQNPTSQVFGRISPPFVSSSARFHLGICRLVHMLQISAKILNQIPLHSSEAKCNIFHQVSESSLCSDVLMASIPPYKPYTPPPIIHSSSNWHPPHSSSPPPTAGPTQTHLD